MIHGKPHIRAVAHWLYRDGATCNQHLEAAEMLTNYANLREAFDKEMVDNPQFELPEHIAYLLNRYRA